MFWLFNHNGIGVGYKTKKADRFRHKSIETAWSIIYHTPLKEFNKTMEQTT